MLVNYKCTVCGVEKTKYYKTHKDVKDSITCQCKKGCLERQLFSPSTKTTQIIDNGAMARSVELSNDVIEKETEILKGRGEL